MWQARKAVRTVPLAAASMLASLLAPIKLAFDQAGKPVRDLGVITMTLRKGAAGWRITGAAWSDQ
jgi:hypothetical protein